MEHTIPKHIKVLAMALSALVFTLMIFIMTNVYKPGILEPSMFEQRPMAFLATWVVTILIILCSVTLAVSAVRWSRSRLIE